MAPHRLDWEKAARKRIIWERGVYDRRSDIRNGDDMISTADAAIIAKTVSDRGSAAVSKPAPHALYIPPGWSTECFTLNIEIEGRTSVRLTYQFRSIAPDHKETIPAMATKLLTLEARTFFLKFEAFLLPQYSLHDTKFVQSPEEIAYSVELWPRKRRLRGRRLQALQGRGV